jgi:hypothetical protein
VELGAESKMERAEMYRYGKVVQYSPDRDDGEVHPGSDSGPPQAHRVKTISWASKTMLEIRQVRHMKWHMKWHMKAYERNICSLWSPRGPSAEDLGPSHRAKASTPRYRPIHTDTGVPLTEQVNSSSMTVNVASTYFLSLRTLNLNGPSWSGTWIVLAYMPTFRDSLSTDYRLHTLQRSLFALPPLVRLRVVRNAVSEEGAYGFAKSPEHAKWSTICMWV